MQLVDRGLISYDSTSDIEKHLPELGKLPLLTGYEGDGEPILVPPKNKITLRHLLTHSAGEVFPRAQPR